MNSQAILTRIRMHGWLITSCILCFSGAGIAAAVLLPVAREMANTLVQTAENNIRNDRAAYQRSILARLHYQSLHLIDAIDRFPIPQRNSVDHAAGYLQERLSTGHLRSRSLERMGVAVESGLEREMFRVTAEGSFEELVELVHALESGPQVLRIRRLSLHSKMEEEVILAMQVEAELVRSIAPDQSSSRR